MGPIEAAVYGILIGLSIVICLEFFKFEIIFQTFYFTVFLRFLFAISCWLMSFGTKTYTVWWSWNGREYTATLPGKDNNFYIQNIL